MGKGTTELVEISFQKARELSRSILEELDCLPYEIDYIIQNLIAAELAGKGSHGLMRLFSFKKQNKHKGELLNIINESESLLHIDAEYRIGMPVIYQALNRSIKKTKKIGLVSLGIKNIVVSGYIGDYALQVTNENLIFIGFSNAPDAIIPHGTTRAIFGTNPITIGIPNGTNSIILDMASSKIPMGRVANAIREGKKLEDNVAMDSTGNITTDPEKVKHKGKLFGGLLPISEHKGSGLAMMIQILAGLLTGSKINEDLKDGRGVFYILLDPTIFMPLKIFQDSLNDLVTSLKEAPLAEGFSEVLFPGESSNRNRKKGLEKGSIKISKNLYEQLT